MFYCKTSLHEVVLDSQCNARTIKKLFWNKKVIFGKRKSPPYSSRRKNILQKKRLCSLKIIMKRFSTFYNSFFNAQLTFVFHFQEGFYIVCNHLFFFLSRKILMHLAVCSCHVTYALESESTLYRTYSQMHLQISTQNTAQLFGPVWPNGWVLV